MKKKNKEEDEYDEYDFPVISNKGFSHSGITMHKIKYDSNYWLRNEEENPIEKNFIQNFNDKHFKKSSLIKYSKILTDYQKITKINSFLKRFYLDCEDKIKLIYRASDDKEFLFENFIKSYLNSKNKIIIMRTSIDLYFIKTFNFPEYKWDNAKEEYYIFYIDKFIKLENTNLTISDNNKNGHPQFELTNFLYIFNSYNSGKILNSEKNTKFSVIDIEILSIINNKFDEK